MASSNNVELIVLSRFKTGLIDFVDELCNWLPTDDQLLTTRIMLQDQVPIEDVMNKFVKFVKPYESQIENEDEAFFLSDPQVFQGVRDTDRLMSFKALWTHPEFTAADRKKAWEWMKFFLKCVNLYIHHHKINTN